MPIAPEIIRGHLTELPRRRSLDTALELFDALGYQYADELPLPTRDWPAGVRRLVNRNAESPIYLAQHRDFCVVYTHLTTDDLSRTVERPIVEHTLHKLHPYALFVAHGPAGRARPRHQRAGTPEPPRVAEWERELNALVYELYGLTEGEIGVVEGLNH